MENSNSSLIGIGVAISGNVVISLALNCQKLAHLRLEKERTEALSKSAGSTNTGHLEVVQDEDGGETVESDETVTPEDRRAIGESTTELSIPSRTIVVETDPLIVRRTSSSSRSCSRAGNRSESGFSYSLRQWFLPRRGRENLRRQNTYLAVDVPHDVLRGRASENERNKHPKDSETENNAAEAGYLKSKLWWFGFLLMNVGELGNFISYAFAPASVVAPLGSFALIANCIFAPLMLHERLRKRDFFGVFLAIVGAVTVVASSKQTDVRWNSRQLIHAFSQITFIVYTCVAVAAMIVLATLSNKRAGTSFVFVDVGLCALFGGFTVLSTKGISTLVSLQGFGAFREWILYPLLVVLAGTGFGQVRYLNRALMKFDSKVVVPTQFVLFNLSAIVGSAVLYEDFRNTTFHQMVTFIYGCAATFAGTFLLSSEDSIGGANTSPDVERQSTTNGAGHTRLLIPSSSSTPILRNRTSKVSLVGISPAQRLFISSTTPPTDGHRHILYVRRDSEAQSLASTRRARV